jgi:histidinol-phosphate aminotransferase
MRVGYALGNADLIAAINCVKNSFNSYPLDRLALAAGQAAIEDKDYFESTRRSIMATRERTCKRLRELGFFVHESCANFIFITHPQVSGQALQQGLRDRGILVRWFNKPRIDQYLRVSIGTDEDMDAMCRACEAILKG